ncbi:MAG TPA: peptidase T [Clostridiales bacterium]|jgi:tripeptide aminopeptidase|nr:peptidase T [Clostridiales bacterium]
MKAYERLIKYTKVNTASSEGGNTTPSTPGQFELARLLVDELKELGVKDARVDDKCYVYGIIPASAGCEGAVRLGFIAHLDTSPDFSGEGVNPRVIENYDGGDLPLGQSGRVMRVSDFPHLTKLRGKTLIVTDGNTLLGADDKAGIAEIMTMVERLQKSGEPHGQISICYTPDEEVGAGADYFDIAGFGADFAYTVDGGEAGEVVFENFNAAGAEFEVRGVSIHPGDAKDKMVNAQLVAMEINSMLPPGETPRDTEGYEGFFHLCRTEGSVGQAKLTYIVRDHDAELFDRRIEILRDIESAINSKYGDGTARLKIKEQYRNMREVIMPHYHLIENAMAASGEAGAGLRIRPIRGGTDGARLSFMGLPCPNLGTGGYAFHGPFEHITAEDMEDVVNILLGIVRRYRTMRRGDAIKA